MTLATLSEVLQPALRDGHAVAGLVVLGWEDARAYVAAAEAVGCPVILQAGPGCRAHTPLPVLAAMFRHLAQGATVPVVAHLDHGYSAEECREAVECGFTSVMFDGSKLPLAENIAQTAEIARMAHAAGVSVEGEIGFVGYAAGAESLGTDPAEAKAFAEGTGVDAMAVSVGNVHLQQDQSASIDMDRLRAIEAVSAAPLVLHGSSGVPAETRRMLARETRICKFNIGTELRQVFGRSLRAVLAADPTEFDRNKILSQIEAPLQAATEVVLRQISRA
ncbi:5-keto-2-deoxy-D-gluconate-6 phosphate aldolase [Candidatus Rhodobacter oscarellae]|uniref:5-keto-2-deoxy-D-gluconate-6 phosphate aldolase n=1 Tax=Candidatus Rhodobacter oscarellae TaxID=1675527 RepID=A0A0J9E5R8_9RHOB|nr:class II fructose-bisphosphate aldolase [Candidatus Rhodobacter lobularis]KMW58100.1 5-keto-2-deoxy-D-gluconate-6 phosphate aldolase [Candidatus Rhodobacter lobularis]